MFVFHVGLSKVLFFTFRFESHLRLLKIKTLLYLSAMQVTAVLFCSYNAPLLAFVLEW